MIGPRFAVALCALAALLPANSALADEPTVAGSEPAESEAAPAPADETALAQEAEPSSPATAKPAQSDFGAPNEYTEEGVPDGTGEDAPPEEPVDDGASEDTQPAAPSQPSATAPSAEVSSDVTSAGDLPRTGPAGPALALAGVVLLALGFLVRRIAAAKPLG